jgi:two-component system NarL family sensor kinase
MFGLKSAAYGLLSRMTLRQQILALATVPLVLAILAITLLVTSQSRELAQEGIATFERNLLQSKRAELRNYINLALTAISDIYENAGPDDEVAKTRVKTILSGLSYGEDGYFFVYDYDGNNIAHPRQPFRVGLNWIELTDPDGDQVIRNLIAQARKGGGFHAYKWEKPSSSEVGDKLSYAIGLDKWQWMVGTGVYIDDVTELTLAADADLKASIDRTFLWVAAITVPAVIGVFLTGILLTLRERRLADGKLNELTQRIIDTQEEERTRIARELHDGISQNMVGVRYVLDLAQRKAREGAPDTLATIERGADGLTGAIKEVRRISHDLRPGLLDDLGLTAALEGLTNNFMERTGIDTKLQSVAFKNLLSPDAKTALYRVAQEALTNIERHAEATEVSINLSSSRAGLRLEVADNGKGFQMDGRKKHGPGQGGLGLRNMQERMAHFGGNLTMQSSREGTRLIATLPKSNYLNQKKESLDA